MCALRRHVKNPCAALVTPCKVRRATAVLDSEREPGSCSVARKGARLHVKTSQTLTNDGSNKNTQKYRAYISEAEKRSRKIAQTPVLLPSLLREDRAVWHCLSSRRRASEDPWPVSSEIGQFRLSDTDTLSLKRC